MRSALILTALGLTVLAGCTQLPDDEGVLAPVDPSGVGSVNADTLAVRAILSANGAGGAPMSGVAETGMVGGNERVVVLSLPRHITMVPPVIGTLTALREFHADSASLSVLPGTIEKLTALEVLQSRGGEMTGIPSTIGALRNLRVLDLAHNKITSLPMELGGCQSLQVLNMQGNALNDVPDAIRVLAPLTSVNLRMNRMCNSQTATVQWAEMRDPAWKVTQRCGTNADLEGKTRWNGTFGWFRFFGDGYFEHTDVNVPGQRYWWGVYRSLGAVAGVVQIDLTVVKSDDIVDTVKTALGIYRLHPVVSKDSLSICLGVLGRGERPSVLRDSTNYAKVYEAW